ncbi:MAG TPA: hypothetical protein VFE16_04970 [Candidatus Cybelea sp.]|nr:hypothetical protein [Candidatus Cybelea sp.]
MTRSIVHWVLGRALRFAVGTCVVALILATTLAGDGAERFATTAYLAAIFAALALAVQRAIPITDEEGVSSAPAAPFPTFLAYAIGIAVLLTLVSSLVSLPGAESFALVVAVALVVASALARSGALAEFHAALVRGGLLVAASRYAIAIGLLALVIAAFAGGEASESIVRIAYRLVLLATLFVAASLVAQTSAGESARVLWLRTTAFFDRGILVAAVAAVAAMVVAGILPAPYSEPFAVAAYAAAACAAIGVAMECRRLRS